jgi:hypothetical protein
MSVCKKSQLAVKGYVYGCDECDFSAKLPRYYRLCVICVLTILRYDYDLFFFSDLRAITRLRLTIDL